MAWVSSSKSIISFSRGWEGTNLNDGIIANSTNWGSLQVVTDSETLFPEYANPDFACTGMNHVPLLHHVLMTMQISSRQKDLLFSLFSSSWSRYYLASDAGVGNSFVAPNVHNVVQLIALPRIRPTQTSFSKPFPCLQTSRPNDPTHDATCSSGPLSHASHELHVTRLHGRFCSTPRVKRFARHQLDHADHFCPPWWTTCGLTILGSGRLDTPARQQGRHRLPQ